MTFSVARPGLNTTIGGNTELWFEGFAGEVILAYEKNVKLMDKVTVRNLPKGMKSVSYPVINTGVGKYHTPGDDLIEDAGYNNVFAQGSRDIIADKAYYSVAMVDDNDNQLTAYDARVPYSSQLGGRVASHLDYQIMRSISYNAGFASSVPFTGAMTGTTIGSANAASQANAYINAVLDLQAKFDNNGVPMEDRYLIMTPTIRGLILKADSNNSFVHLDRDFNGAKAAGSVQDGTVGSIAGFQVIVHNNLPAITDLDVSNRIGSDANYGNTYTGVNTALLGLAFQKSAVVVAVAKPITTEQYYIPEKNGTMLKAGMMVGIGVVRQEGVGRIISS
jgi:hypothetical protein